MNLGPAFPGLPFLQAACCPCVKASDSLDSPARAAATTSAFGNVISVSAGHAFEVGSLTPGPSASVSCNDLRGDDPAGDFTSWGANLNHAIGLESPLTLSGGVGWSRTDVADEAPDTRLYFDVTPSCTPFGNWSNSLPLGATYGFGTRLDARLGSSFPLGRACDVRLGIADADYSGTAGRYNDLRLTAELRRAW